MNALEVSDVSFSYGAREVLHALSFSCPKGRLTALLGPNGAGKTTLISLLTCLFPIQKGQIHVSEHDLSRTPRLALRELGVVFQQSTLDLDLSVEQNLRYHASLHGFSPTDAKQRINDELARQHLSDRRHDKVRLLNGGHRRRVEITRALLHNPRLLLLDEASVGLDPASRQALQAHLRSLCAERDIAVLSTTHLLDEIGPEDHVLILNQGALVANGSIAAIQAQYQQQSLPQIFAQLTQKEAL
ncbi:MAG: ATP-binding cassette domain-containing protein [Desulfuromonas sp.]|nr:ATP-binding cassette domain-containing protein [Desulfuromonas sp.]